MSGGGGGDKTITQSSKVELPSYAQPYSLAALQGAGKLLETPYQQYPGERIAGFTPEQQLALAGTANFAANNAITGAGGQQIVDTLSGRYLDPSTNPAYSAGVNQITNDFQTGALPQFNSVFSKANAFGSDNSAFNEYSGQLAQKGLGQPLANLWGNIYQGERANQMNALGQVPSISGANYTDLTNLYTAGGVQQQQQQQALDTAYQTWAAQNQYPWTQAQNFAGLIPGLLGNSGTSTATGPNPYQSNPAAGAVSGALLGAGASGLLGTAGVAGGVAAGFPYLLPLVGAGAALGYGLS
jgi:hypothetical protein